MEVGETNLTSVLENMNVAGVSYEGSDVGEEILRLDGEIDNIAKRADEAKNKAIEAIEIANAKKFSIVFDTEEQMNQFLTDETNKGFLHIGSNIYVRENGVPDRWVVAVLDETLETGFYYVTDIIEGEKIDLSIYDDIHEKVSSNICRVEFDTRKSYSKGIM